MNLEPTEKAEMAVLLRDCGLTLHYPESYTFDPSEDVYTDIDDKHEWYDGTDVRRLRELARKAQQ